jgi:WhiB family transcriptional regulator, redox-sensing transcriptional regulator
MPDNTFSVSTPVRLLRVPEAVFGFPGTWSERAICRGEDPDAFFPAHGDPGARARQVCANCPVRIDCLEYAVAADEWGIWGGLDREQRRALRDSADDPTKLPDYGVASSKNGERA